MFEVCRLNFLCYWHYPLLSPSSSHFINRMARESWRTLYVRNNHYLRPRCLTRYRLRYLVCSFWIESKVETAFSRNENWNISRKRRGRRPSRSFRFNSSFCIALNAHFCSAFSIVRPPHWFWGQHVSTYNFKCGVALEWVPPSFVRTIG